MIPPHSEQRLLWFIDRFEGPPAASSIPFVLRLSGALDVAVAGFSRAELRTTDAYAIGRLLQIYAMSTASYPFSISYECVW